MYLPNQTDHCFLLRGKGQGENGGNCINQFLQFYHVVIRCVTSKSACMLRFIFRLSFFVIITSDCLQAEAPVQVNDRLNAEQHELSRSAIAHAPAGLPKSPVHVDSVRDAPCTAVMAAVAGAVA
jgi:hypothetical protein